MSEETNYWAEGNTNKAARNIYSALDVKKLLRIKNIIQKHYNLYKESPTEIVSWLDNNVMFPNGYLIEHKTNKDIVKRNKWIHDYKMISEKNPMLRKIGSFESIIIFLLRQNDRFLDTFESLYDKQANSTQIQTAGSDSFEVVHEFLKIHPENANIVKNIIKSFDMEHDDIDTKITNYLATDMISQWPNIQPQITYSERTNVFDIWKITIYLLSLDKDEVNQYYNHVIHIVNERKIQDKKAKNVMKNLKNYRNM